MKPFAKKNSDHTDGEESNSELSPGVTCKKHNPNPGKGEQYNTASHHGTHCYCFLCNKSRYPDCRYKSHSSDNYNSFDSSKTKKDLDGFLTKFGASVKKFHKSYNNMQKHMKALKNHNKMIFNMAKKNSTRRYLNNIKKVSKAIYESSSINNSITLR